MVPHTANATPPHDAPVKGASADVRQGPILRHLGRALRNAALKGSSGDVAELLKAGANPNTRDAVGHTPLHYAAMRYEQGRHVHHFLAAGADPNARNIANDTPLHYLAARCQATKDAGVAGLSIPAVVGAGLAATPSRTARATGLVMSLAAIASLGHDREKIHATIDMLIAAGAELGARNDGRETPLALARRLDHALIARTLANPAKNSMALGMAARNGEFERVAKLIADGWDVNAPDRWNNRPPLHDAVERSQSELAAVLLDAGAKIDAHGGRDGVTALHIAARRADIDTMEVLLPAGADPNARNRLNRTPLHAAATAMLVWKRDPVYTPPPIKPGGCFLLTGHLPRYVEAIELLIEHQASLFLGDHRADMPIHVACLRPRVRRAGRSAARREHTQGNPSQIEPRHLPADIQRRRHGPTARRGRGRPDNQGAARVRCRHQRAELRRVYRHPLRDLAAARPPRGTPPRAPSPRRVRGRHRARQDDATALHMAASREFYTAIIALLDAGADPLIKDKAGRRACDLLLRKTNFIPEHYEEALRRLKEATAKAIEAQTTGEGARTG